MVGLNAQEILLKGRTEPEVIRTGGSLLIQLCERAWKGGLTEWPCLQYVTCS